MTDPQDPPSQPTSESSAPAAQQKQAIPGYQLLTKLGAGSIGAVYKARQVSLDRIVAIKVLHPALARTPHFAERFVAEARTLARLQHPHIVTPIDVGFTGTHYFLVMEFIDGKTVDQLLSRGGSLDEKRALTITFQIALALEHIADHDMVHRDVKPANIILSKTGVAKLCDLGFAMLKQDAVGPGGATGTPHYMSPEQAQGKDVDIRSDLYSLGATLYHMVTGRTPFEGNDPGAVIAQHLNGKPIAPGRLRPDLHPDTAPLVDRMLEKRPDRRFLRPREVVREVERILVELGVSPYDSAVRSARPAEGPQRRPSEPAVRPVARVVPPPQGTPLPPVPAAPVIPPPAQNTSAPPPLPPPLPAEAAAPRPGNAAPNPAAEEPSAEDRPRVVRLAGAAARFRGMIATSRRKRRPKRP